MEVKEPKTQSDSLKTVYENVNLIVRGFPSIWTKLMLEACSDSRSDIARFKFVELVPRPQGFKFMRKND